VPPGSSPTPLAVAAHNVVLSVSNDYIAIFTPSTLSWSTPVTMPVSSWPNPPLSQFWEEWDDWLVAWCRGQLWSVQMDADDSWLMLGSWDLLGSGNNTVYNLTIPHNWDEPDPVVLMADEARARLWLFVNDLQYIGWFDLPDPSFPEHGPNGQFVNITGFDVLPGAPMLNPIWQGPHPILWRGYMLLFGSMNFAPFGWGLQLIDADTLTVYTPHWLATSLVSPATAPMPVIVFDPANDRVIIGTANPTTVSLLDLLPPKPYSPPLTPTDTQPMATNSRGLQGPVTLSMAGYSSLSQLNDTHVVLFGGAEAHAGAYQTPSNMTWLFDCSTLTLSNVTTYPDGVTVSYVPNLNAHVSALFDDVLSVWGGLSVYGQYSWYIFAVPQKWLYQLDMNTRYGGSRQWQCPIPLSV
jgi:hypothetical protein